MEERDAQPADEAPHYDPAAPHTAPFPSHIPRWVAWLLLAAFAGCAVMCARAVVG